MKKLSSRLTHRYLVLLLLSSSSDPYDVIQIYDAQTGEPFPLRRTRGHFKDVSFSPAGRWLAMEWLNRDYGGCADLRTGENLKDRLGESVRAVSFSADSGWLIASYAGGGMGSRLFNLKDRAGFKHLGSRQIHEASFLNALEFFKFMDRNHGDLEFYFSLFHDLEKGRRLDEIGWSGLGIFLKERLESGRLPLQVSVLKSSKSGKFCASLSHSLSLSTKKSASRITVS